MKKQFIANIIQSMILYLDNSQLEHLQQVLTTQFADVDIAKLERNCEKNADNENKVLISSFIAAKRIEGCSEKSLKYYENTIQCTVNNIAKDIKHLTTDDLRLCLTEYQERHNSSRVTIDNIRRILSSFFSWLEGGIESRLRKLGQNLNIHKVHPHKFRRTLATMAIDKGMPIEQLQRLLGHQRIDTTLQYAMVKQSNVKLAHKKYIG